MGPFSFMIIYFNLNPMISINFDLCMMIKVRFSFETPCGCILMEKNVAIIYISRVNKLWMGKQSTGANRGDIFIKDHKKFLRQKKILIYLIVYYDF